MQIINNIVLIICHLLFVYGMYHIYACMYACIIFMHVNPAEYFFVLLYFCSYVCIYSPYLLFLDFLFFWIFSSLFWTGCHAKDGASMHVCDVRMGRFMCA
jgi:hypothetical protein